jgi:hypothetical protein
MRDVTNIFHHPKLASQQRKTLDQDLKIPVRGGIMRLTLTAFYNFIIA